MSKKRGLLVCSLLVLARTLMFVSSLTVWSKLQLLDDEAWARSSAQRLANAETPRPVPAASGGSGHRHPSKTAQSAHKERKSDDRDSRKRDHRGIARRARSR
jgi:hypothetical protein